MTENSVHLIGNIGKDPIIRYLEPTICFARFSLATEAESILNADGWPINGPVTDWHAIQCFYDLAVWVSNELRVGDLVEVEGRLTYLTQKGTRDQLSNKQAVILADKITLLKHKKVAEPEAPQVERPTDPYGIYRDVLDQDPDGLPF